MDSSSPLLARGIGIGIGGVAGGGRVLVFPMRVVIMPDRTTARISGVDEVVVSPGARITVVCARLMFPWMNLAVFVKGRSGETPINVTLHGPCFGRKKLVEAFKRGGFSVVEQRAWVRVGWLASWDSGGDATESG